MDAKRLIVTVVVAVAMVAGLSARLQNDGVTAGSTATAQPVDTAGGHTRICVNMAITMRGNTIPVSADHILELRGDSVTACLPYFGRAYSAPMGTDNVLDFSVRASGMTVESTDDGAKRITFSARTIEDLFKFRVTIYDNGRATIDVQPQQRERISFDGYVDEGR